MDTEKWSRAPQALGLRRCTATESGCFGGADIMMFRRAGVAMRPVRLRQLVMAGGARPEFGKLDSV
jgi:hypothetical protein